MPCSLTPSPMISPTGSLGERLENGSWNTIWIVGRIFRSSSLLKEKISCPLIYTSPEVFSCRRSRVLPVVDLPQPDSPTRPMVVPLLMVKETPSTAFT